MLTLEAIYSRRDEEGDCHLDGRALSKSAQVRMCGNSVCPPLARAIVAANYSERGALREAA